MAPRSAADLLAADAAHVWHPYAPPPPGHDVLLVRRAEGVRIEVESADQGPRWLIDAMSSWWAAIHGYNHPHLNAAVTAQIGAMSHVMFGGLTHEPAIALAERLVALTPAGLDRVFFCDSGSVAVEIALKMAIQYQVARGRADRHRIGTWKRGYHGDTMHPMSVCDPDLGMHRHFGAMVPVQVFAEAPPAGLDEPTDDAYIAHLADVFARHGASMAAFVVEPVLQGAGRMQAHSPAYLRALADLCTAHDVVLVFDEIATAFGRIGPTFAADLAGVSPDVMCVGKALTGGYVSLAATLCNGRVAETLSDGPLGVMAHGPTFMGNPLAAAVANASLDLLAEVDLPATIARLERGLRQGLAPATDTPGVVDVRTIGAVGVIEMATPVDMRLTTAAATNLGVWLRPFGNLIYAMPPFVIDDDDLAAVGAAMVAAATAASAVLPHPMT